MGKLQLILVVTGVLLATRDTPAWAQSAGGPNGAAARCKDGSLVFVWTSAACSGHGGVVERFATPPAPQQVQTERRVGPNGAFARCGDGRLVFADAGEATCRGAGGVAERFRPATPSDLPSLAQPTARTAPPSGGALEPAPSSPETSPGVTQPRTPSTSTRRPSGPSGAVARCGNGSLVFVSSGSKTCQGYGGVLEWFDPDAPVLANGGTQASGDLKWWEALILGLAVAASGYGDGLAGANASGLPIASGKLMIFGGAGSRTYLGCLSCGELAPDAVKNRLGPHGSQLSAQSILNTLGPYGSTLSNFSVCNALASDPPKVVDAEGRFYGRLTVNDLHPERTTNDVLRAFAKGICSRQ
jgi:hypothetical protein